MDIFIGFSKTKLQVNQKQLLLKQCSRSQMFFNIIQDEAFWGCTRMGGKKAPLP